MSETNKLTRRFINSPHLATPLAPYSPGVLIGNTLYISAQAGRVGSSGDLIAGGIGPEAKQALTNVGHVLTAAGTSYKNVVKVKVMLADIKDWEKFNEVYSQFFSKPYPARAMLQAGALPIANSRIEIEAIAVVENITDVNEEEETGSEQHKTCTY